MFEDKQTAIETFFKTNVTGVALVFENAPTPDADEFIRIAVLFGTSKRMQIGGGAYRHPGIVAVQIFQREGVGINRGVELADVVSTAFRDKVNSEVNYQVPYVTKFPNAYEGWYQVQVSIPFYIDEVTI